MAIQWGEGLQSNQIIEEFPALFSLKIVAVPCAAGRDGFYMISLRLTVAE